MKNFEKYKNQIIDYYQKHNVTLGVAVMKVQQNATEKVKDPIESFKWLYEEADNSILDSTEKRIIREMLLRFEDKTNIYVTRFPIDETRNRIEVKQSTKLEKQASKVWSYTDQYCSVTTEGSLFNKMKQWGSYTLEELGI